MFQFYIFNLLKVCVTVIQFVKLELLIMAEILLGRVELHKGMATSAVVDGH